MAPNCNTEGSSELLDDCLHVKQASVDVGSYANANDQEKKKIVPQTVSRCPSTPSGRSSL